MPTTPDIRDGVISNAPYGRAPYWATREPMAQMGAGVIAVEHDAFGMCGTEDLCDHLPGQAPDVAFQYLAQHPRAWTVRGR